MDGPANGSMGAQIRRAREAQGLTLKALAEAVGVTPSLLSQVENDKAQPSLNTLRSVAVRLQLSGDALLGLGGAARVGGRAVQRRADNPTLNLDAGAHWERLGGSVERAFEIVRITYPPRSRSVMVGEQIRFQGYEFGVLLSGELTLHLGFESVVLEAGDSVHFDTSEPHAYDNTADHPAEGVWFIVRDPAIQARIVAGLRASGRGRGAGAPLPAVLSALRHEEF
jgi:transcriptional regulator with XRE-family HTH domain